MTSHRVCQKGIHFLEHWLRSTPIDQLNQRLRSNKDTVDVLNFHPTHSTKVKRHWSTGLLRSIFFSINFDVLLFQQFINQTRIIGKKNLNFLLIKSQVWLQLLLFYTFFLSMCILFALLFFNFFYCYEELFYNCQLQPTRQGQRKRKKNQDFASSFLTFRSMMK